MKRLFDFPYWNMKVDLYATGANIHNLKGIIGSLQAIQYSVKHKGWQKWSEREYDKLLAHFNGLLSR